MKNILSKMLNPAKNIAGLDIGSSYIKFMEVEGETLDSLKIVHYAVEPIPRELMAENGKFENIQEVADLVRKCWKKSGSSIKNVAVALPISAIINKKVILPQFDIESDFQVQVENEITKYLPDGIGLNDIALDYYVMNQNLQSPTENDTLLVAAKKEKIEERRALVEAAGLIPTVLDVEPFALQNMVRLMKGEDFLKGTYVLADCSSHVLRLLVFRNGELVYTKDTSIGGMNLTQDIMNNFGVDFLNAERIKLERTGDETYDMVEKTFINNYCSEFMRAFSYFTSATSVSEVDEVILTGGMTAVPHIEYAIKAALLENNEVIVKNDPYIARPLENAGKSSKISLNKFTRDEPSLFLVTSLALRKYLRQY